MVGVSLAEGVDAPAVARRALDERPGDKRSRPGMLRFLPPLVIGEDDVERRG